MARRADVVHSNSVWGHPECALGARLGGRRAVLEVHDIVAEGLGRRLLGLAARLAASTVAISGAVADCLPDSVRDRVVEVPQGVDTDVFVPGDANPDVRRALSSGDGPIIAVVGRIDPAKNVDTVVRAVAQLSDDELGPLNLAVVGAAYESERYADELQRAAVSQLGDRVRFLGRRDDVAEVMKSVDVLVSAAEAEPFGLTLLEAQASGTPVVATDAGGPADFIQSGVTGLLVPPGDSDLLASALRRVLEDGALRSSMVEAARATVVDQYSLAARADRFAAIYRGAAR